MAQEGKTVRASQIVGLGPHTSLMVLRAHIAAGHTIIWDLPSEISQGRVREIAERILRRDHANQEEVPRVQLEQVPSQRT